MNHEPLPRRRWTRQTNAFATEGYEQHLTRAVSCGLVARDDKNRQDTLSRRSVRNNGDFPTHHISTAARAARLSHTEKQQALGFVEVSVARGLVRRS